MTGNTSISFTKLFLTLIFCAALSLLIIGCGKALAAGPPSTQWEVSYPGEGDFSGNSIRQTPDGGYIVAGYSGPYPYYDVLLAKLDSQGGLQWWETFSDTVTDFGNCVQVTSDGGYIVTGSSYDTEHSDVLLIRTDFQGNLLWKKNYAVYDYNYGTYVQQTPDRGFIVAGVAVRYFDNATNIVNSFLLKLDMMGNVQWQRTYFTGQNNIANAMILTKNNGYAVAGIMYNERVTRAMMYVTDSNGRLLWNRTYGASGKEFGNGLAQGQDGSITLVCNSYQMNDILLIKTDQTGNIRWNKYLGKAPTLEQAYALQITNDGGIIVAGDTGSDYPEDDVYIVRTDSKGNKKWELMFGGPYGDYATDIISTSDGGYAVVGYTEKRLGGNAELYVIKLGVDDQVSPKVVGTYPSSVTYGVLNKVDIRATFSEPISTASINDKAFQVISAGGTLVQGNLTVNGNIATFTPSRPLTAGNYTAIVKGSVKDLYGNTMGLDHSWIFTISDGNNGGKIVGFAFNDVNRNGRMDAGEAGIKGALIRLFDMNGRQAGYAYTGPTGNYIVTGLNPGKYRAVVNGYGMSTWYNTATVTLENETRLDVGCIKR